MSSTGDEDLLSRFREEWKKEINQRLKGVHGPPPASSTSANQLDASTATEIGSPKGDQARKLSISQDGLPLKEKPPSQDSPLTGFQRVTTTASMVLPTLTQGQQRAIVIYRQAVELEQNGDSDGALRLYRDSFRMDSNVDKLYYRLALLEEANTTRPIRIPSKSEKPAPQRESIVQSAPPVVVAPALPVSLLTLIEGFDSEDLHFTAENENKSIPIEGLPPEILVLIMYYFASGRDALSIERFGSTCRKARLLSLDAVLWKRLIERTYVPPQASQQLDPVELLELYGDYRNAYISHPRVRMDGVYIAVCHYVRRGQHENPWVALTHLITYHRFLRFLPNGTVLSFLSSEDTPPSQVVQLLKPSFKAKGHYLGTWYMEDSTVYVKDLTDSEGVITRYGFEMTLELRSKPLGRWNKLDFTDYRTVNFATGESEPLVRNHERPFWFSKVRSYHA